RAAIVSQLALELVPVIQVVPWLQALVAWISTGAADAPRFSKACRTEVGCADEPHLACTDELRVSLEGLVDRRVRIVAMRLIEIDVLGIQPLQRALHRTQDVLLGQAGFPRRHFHAHLGGDDHPVADVPPPQPVADDALRLAALVAGYPERIRIRGVDEVESGRDKGIEHPEGGRLVRGPPEDIAAESQRANLQPGSAEFAFDHGWQAAMLLRPRDPEVPHRRKSYQDSSPPACPSRCASPW